MLLCRCWCTGVRVSVLVLAIYISVGVCPIPWSITSEGRERVRQVFYVTHIQHVRYIRTGSLTLARFFQPFSSLLRVYYEQKKVTFPLNYRLHCSISVYDTRALNATLSELAPR